ncbi:hypothetical protein ABZT28_24475 [Streptomyces sp. NPDC005388]|uniref:hypothetical protein n=1 Tax=Streptomyces sp. NPDC005388 TaxID=3156717 RepID=UPI0033BEC1AD
MNDPAALRLRHALEHAGIPVRPGTDQGVVHAFEWIVTGNPEHPSGARSVSTLCTEAAISRATYYSSPLAKIITGLLRTPDAPRPQTDTLTADIARLKKADRTPRANRVRVRTRLPARPRQVSALQHLAGGCVLSSWRTSRQRSRTPGCPDPVSYGLMSRPPTVRNRSHRTRRCRRYGRKI